jgi:hypothetical protein
MCTTGHPQEAGLKNAVHIATRCLQFTCGCQHTWCTCAPVIVKLVPYQPCTQPVEVVYTCGRADSLEPTWWVVTSRRGGAIAPPIRGRGSRSGIIARTLHARLILQVHVLPSEFASQDVALLSGLLIKAAKGRTRGTEHARTVLPLPNQTSGTLNIAAHSAENSTPAPAGTYI